MNMDFFFKSYSMDDVITHVNWSNSFRKSLRLNLEESHFWPFIQYLPCRQLETSYKKTKFLN